MELQGLNRLSLFLLLVLGCFLLRCGSPGDGVAPSLTTETPVFGESKAPRNLVMICIDTVRKDVFSFPDGSGPEDSLSPWVRRALRMEKAQSAAPWTVPSVASILTGLYPNQHGAGRFSELPANLSEEIPTGIASSVPTLTERLVEHGFETIGFTAHPWFTLDYGLDRGFSALHLRKSSEELVGMGLQWLDERTSRESAVTSQESAPFFLYLHFMEAHEQHRRPEAELDEALVSKTGAWKSSIVDLAPAGICDRRDLLSCKQWLAYSAAVVDLRSRVASMLKGLESRGLLDETVVLLYSDHGEEFTDHQDAGRKTGGDPRSLYGAGHGQSLYQELLHVPLLVWYPTWPGGEVAEPVSLVDVVPTLEEWFALTPIDGGPRSLGQAFAPKKDDRREERPLFASGIAYGIERMSVVEGNWKMIAVPGKDSDLLFDLQQDPREQHPLVKLRAPHLDDLLDRYFAFGEGNFREGPVDISPEKLKELQALGYLEGQ